MSLVQRVAPSRLGALARVPGFTVRAGVAWLTAAGIVGCGGDASTRERALDAERGDAEMEREAGATAAMPTLEMPAAPTCPWRIDDLLVKAQVAPSGRIDCGMVNATQGGESVLPALDCFTAAAVKERTVEFTVINCVDCWIASTFVSTPPDGILHVFTEYAAFSDLVRESRVEHCSGVSYERGDTVRCIQPMMLFACEGPLSDILE
jgi:hypothetical protein